MTGETGRLSHPTFHTRLFAVPIKWHTKETHSYTEGEAVRS